MNVSFSQEINKMDAKGKRHGAWKGYYEDSKILRYEGTFDHGIEKGMFTFYANSDKKIIMATRNFDGKGGAYTIFYDDTNNKVSEGKVVNKLRQGVWKYYHKGKTSIMTTETYVNDKIEGVRKVFFPDGSLAEEVMYKNGLKNGTSKKYNDKGALVEDTFYVNDELHGKYKVYDEKGLLAIDGQFKKDKKNGLWNYYFEGKHVRTINADTINGYKKPSLVKKKEEIKVNPK